MLENTFALIDSQPALHSMLEEMRTARAVALDIETINWWDRANEKVALIQLAFRGADGTRVMIIDALAGLDLDSLRGVLEESSIPKAIHNASFDAIRLAHHLRIFTDPIHDTMLAARRSGARRWSLKAQVDEHLGVKLDKHEQRSDWSRRPLAPEQLRYAALDASCTLLLYERQVSMGIRGNYYLQRDDARPQFQLPLEPTTTDLLAPATALLGIAVELSGRYSPEQLAASVGSDRIGLAGWIIDRTIGREADIDEGTARQEIARLCEEGLVVINTDRRLEATITGIESWKGRE
ncbi:MAG: ribonuclease D [Acidobacteriota bacterium]